MEPITPNPFCSLPAESRGDMVPLLVIVGVFLLGGWLFRRKKKKDSKKKD